MESVNSIYINALLADAAYTEGLFAGIDTTTLIARLTGSMTVIQAQFVAANFDVLSNPTTGGGVLTSGFDATVWRGKAGTPYADKVYVSMRGTTGLADKLTDIDLAFNGAARAQYVDMINWWLKASTPAGQQAAQVKLTSGGDGLYFAAAPTVTSTGGLSGLTHVEVIGHSLGGHLATAFSRLFGTRVSVDHITTFKSAGFRASSDAVMREIEGLLGSGTGLYPDSKQQTNIFAKNGLNVTTNDLSSWQIGQRVDLFNEEGTGVSNHSMYKLTDTLALGAALAKLDSALSTAKLNALLEAGANQTQASIEGLLDGLRRNFSGNGIAPTPIGDVDGDAVSRKTYHETLAALQASLAFQSLAGKATIELVTAANLATQAKADFGAFLSLQTLSPIVLRTDAAGQAIFKQANQTLGEQWDADQSLTQAQKEAGLQNFSDVYLQDRQAMLQGLVAQNLVDASRDIPLKGKTLASYTYTDFATSQVIKFSGAARASTTCWAAAATTQSTWETEEPPPTRPPCRSAPATLPSTAGQARRISTAEPSKARPTSCISAMGPRRCKLAAPRRPFMAGRAATASMAVRGPT